MFSKLYVKFHDDEVWRRWREALEGKTVVVAVQTRVELAIWPKLYKWGKKKTLELEELLTKTPVVPVDYSVQENFIGLTVWANENGHAIGAKQHNADRWVAATALAHNLQLAAADGIYRNIDGLDLLLPTKPSAPI